MASENASTLAAAAAWCEHLLTGGLAMAIALIAVAGVGAAMLVGRLSWRRGLNVVLGVFIIFGAPVVARESGAQVSSSVVEDVREVQAVAVTAPVPNAYDPYAGASVPQARQPSDLALPGS